MGRGGGRAGAWGWAVLCAGCVIGLVAWVLSPGVDRGDADPVSAIIALGGLGVAVWTGLMARAAMGVQVVDTAALAARLADRVAVDETRERARLLGPQGRAIDVRFVLRRAPAHNAAGADLEGRLATVVDYYEKLRPRRLLISGMPGSGKTVLAVELLLALLEGRKPQDPVPVRMSLASWTTINAQTADSRGGGEIGDAVRTWIRDHLQGVYGLSRAAARALVEADMVLPVLDGLDEMDATDTPAGVSPRARRALEVLNAYQRGRGRAALVLTCRSGPYEALNDWARDAARVEITPVTPAQARAFITARIDDPARWRDVLDALDTAPSGSLARGLSTPWRLTMAVAAYERRDRNTGAYHHAPRNLMSPSLADDTAMGEHLNQLYLRAAADHRAVAGRGYTPEQVHTWLGVLARYLDTNTTTGRAVGGRTLSGTDLVPHELWPLTGFRRARTIHTLLSAAAYVLILTAAIFTTSDVGSTTQLINMAQGVVWSIPLFAINRSQVWTYPARLDLGRLRTPWGRRLVLLPSVIIGLGVAVMVAIAAGPKDGDGLAMGFAGGITIGLIGLPNIESDTEVRNPRHLVRANLAYGLTMGLAFGLAFGGLAGGFTTDAIGLAAGLAVGLTTASAAVRYLAFLLCVRTGPRALPWRLGRFLHWATQAGLLRTAGTAYQFRHRELQDWLARNPTP